MRKSKKELLILAIGISLLITGCESKSQTLINLETSSKEIQTQTETRVKADGEIVNVITSSDGTMTEQAKEILTSVQTEVPTSAPTKILTSTPIEVPTEVPTEAHAEEPTQAPKEASIYNNPAGLSAEQMATLNSIYAGYTAEQKASQSIYTKINQDSSSGGNCPYALLSRTTRIILNYDGTTVELQGYYGIGPGAYSARITSEIWAEWGIVDSQDAGKKVECSSFYVGTYADKGAVYYTYYARR